MSTEGSDPSKKDCEVMAAGHGKPKVSLKDKLPFGKKGKDVNEGDEPTKKKYTLKERINDIKTGFAEISKNKKDKKAQKMDAKAICGTSKEAEGTGKQEMSSRRMVYPYTLSAKIAQFPYRFYINNCWYFRYTMYAIVACLPVFMFIGMKSYSPRNVAEWKEKRKEMFTPHH